MKSKIKIELSAQIPVYKQLIQDIQNLVDKGVYRDGDYIPSMNELANELQISKETVKKAYSILRDKGIIGSSQGKGFYITNNGQNKIKILLIFDKISTYKQVLYSSFIANIGENSEITIRLHNQDIDLFEHFIEENLDKFDYYLVTPHFPLRPDTQKRVIKNLKRIPNRKLIILDRYIEGLSGNFGSAYQDFEQDIYNGMMEDINAFKRFKKLNVISMSGSLYAPLIEKGILKFCTENKINVEVHKNINTNNIQKQEAFLIINSQLDSELIELIRTAKTKDYKIGKDIGIISYNESPINEIILNGLTALSTDFKQMGELAAKMILEKSFKKTKCNFHLIRRSTF
ncbi:MAG: GntR family transcriptional regulator [Paludibacter sp.]|nr:GntR family transcriptional regulator [Paludibacter sp.]